MSAKAPNDPPQGARFSHVYLERGGPVQDSPRMRRRLASLIGSFEDLKEVAKTVEQELGLPGPWSTRGHGWYEFLGEWKLADVLDVVTIVYRYLYQKKFTGIYDVNAPARWLKETQRIFSEENVHYMVDEAGGVHFYFDEEYARNRAATVAALQGARYANVLNSFDAALRSLSTAPPDGKGAIRSVFAAAESLFRLMFPKSPRLTSTEAEKLQPLTQRIYQSDSTASGSSAKLLASFKNWIDAAHYYRHEPGSEEVAQPPLTLAVYLTSLGASHLRWLAELDAAMRSESPLPDSSC